MRQSTELLNVPGRELGASPDDASTELDKYLLDELLSDKPAKHPATSVAHDIVKLARLGGYLGRVHEPPPGNTVIWKACRDLLT